MRLEVAVNLELTPALDDRATPVTEPGRHAAVWRRVGTWHLENNDVCVLSVILL
jgi:hypothetical protein